MRAELSFCGLLLVVLAGCSTKVTLVDCQQRLRHQKINFQSLSTLDQARLAVRARFALSDQQLQLHAPGSATEVASFEELLQHRTLAISVRCTTNAAPTERLLLEGAAAAGGRPALFQLPVSIMNSTTGQRAQRSIVVRAGDTPVTASAAFCSLHGIEDCSPLIEAVRLRMDLDRGGHNQGSLSTHLGGQLQAAASAFRKGGAPSLPGLGRAVPEMRLPPMSELPPQQLVRHFHHSAVPMLSRAWNACASIYRAAPEPPLHDMSQLWTDATAEHWKRSLDRTQPLNVRLYHEREIKDATTQIPVLNWMVRQGRGELCKKGACEWIDGSKFSNLTDLLNQGAVEGQPTIGMAGQQTDLRTTLGNGWTARSSHLVFETERTMSSNTATDVIGTERADGFVGELEQSLRSALGKEFIELRGLFLYAHHGFREFHANMYDPAGWRMYFVHKTVAAANTSWFSIRDPNTRKVFDLPDSDGQVNLFRVSKDAPVWHAITSKNAHRWSCGARLTNEGAEAIIRQLDQPTSNHSGR